MTTLTIARKSTAAAFQNWHLWLIQFIGNPLLFLLFAGWLLIPVANTFYVILNALVAILLLAATFTLHGGTLNYFSEVGTSLYAPLKKMFLRALRNILPILVCAAAIYFLWMLTDKFDELRYRVPSYFRFDPVRWHAKAYFDLHFGEHVRGRRFRVALDSDSWIASSVRRGCVEQRFSRIRFCRIP